MNRKLLFSTPPATGWCFVCECVIQDSIGSASIYYRADFEKEYRELLWNEGDEKYYPKGIEDEDYCILEFIAGSGRYYRYDGKGDLSASEIAAFERGREFENGYNAVNAVG